MPEMAGIERAFCKSAAWRSFTRRVVLPWALQGVRPGGTALEIGSGSGAMAIQMLDAFPSLALTCTDFDPKMLIEASKSLARYGERADVQVADATSLHFPDSSFDQVFSFIMLHHVVKWEMAIAEMTRVLKPGGTLVAYDLLNTLPMRFLHQAEGARFRMIHQRQLVRHLGGLPLQDVSIAKGLGGLVVRFRAQKTMALSC